LNILQRQNAKMQIETAGVGVWIRPMSEIVLASVDWRADRETIAQLFREYVASLDRDISFQGVAEELASLPGKYAPPLGGALIARVRGAAAAAVAFREFAPGVCEMKRLYVRPQFRGIHLGERLTLMVVDEARRLGYRRLVLDTLDSMHAARQVYARLGFTEIAAYYENPLPDTTYMALEL
jgi:ribosomal protein S18 acetylase RimI-like enzyme